MNTLISSIKRHPLVTFFILAYGLSWGNYLLSSVWRDFPFLFPFGPLIAAIIVASITRGRSGLKDFLSRCLRWRVGLKWYAAALLVPVALALVQVFLNVLSGAPMPTAAQLGPWFGVLLLFPDSFIDAPLGEESGWRGFALPRFSASRSPLTNTLILGALLAGWHLPLALVAPSVVAYLIGTVASAVLANWVYYNARESALLVILYHTASNTMGRYFFPMFSGADLVRMSWLFAAVYSLAAVVLILVNGPTLRRQPATQADTAQLPQPQIP